MKLGLKSNKMAMGWILPFFMANQKEGVDGETFRCKNRKPMDSAGRPAFLPANTDGTAFSLYIWQA